jgi:hypothetical protein
VIKHGTFMTYWQVWINKQKDQYAVFHHLSSS